MAAKEGELYLVTQIELQEVAITILMYLHIPPPLLEPTPQIPFTTFEAKEVLLGPD